MAVARQVTEPSRNPEQLNFKHSDMAKRIRKDPSQLTDEEVLSEFVKRFQCDAAILIYKDGDMEHGFMRWVNKAGKEWQDEVIDAIRKRNDHPRK